MLDPADVGQAGQERGAGSLLASRAGFLPGLHLALAVSGAAFLAGVLVTLAWVDRHRPGRRLAGTGQPAQPGAAGQPATGTALGRRGPG